MTPEQIKAQGQENANEYYPDVQAALPRRRTYTLGYTEGAHEVLTKLAKLPSVALREELEEYLKSLIDN